MATIHLGGTRLEPKTISFRLNKPFLITMAVLYLLAMHVFMPNPGGAGLSLTFNNTSWIALSAALGFGLYHLANNRVLLYSKLTLNLFLCAVLLTVPILYINAEPTQVLARLMGLWAGLLLLVCLQQFRLSNKHKQRLLWLIVLACVIEALIGYGQYFLLEPGNIFGYNTETNRPYGIFQQPNVMASFLATGLVLSGYLLARQPVKYNRTISDVSLLYLLPALTLPLIVVLASRTGWLATLSSVLLLLPYLYRFATRRRMIGWLASVAIGVVVGLLLTTGAARDSVSEKVDLDSPRSFTFPQALDMLVEKPFTGYGYGKFESQYILYTARQHQLNPDYPAGLPAMDHPHNELLYWGVEGGLLPVVAIILAALLVLRRIYRAKPGTRLALFSLFVPIVLHSQLEYPFYHSVIHWISFILLIFWVDQRSAVIYKASFGSSVKTGLRVSSLIIPIITSVYMVTAMHSNWLLTQFEKSQPKDPEILNRVTNPLVWQDRFDWDIYSTYLNLGLISQDPELIQPYIDWSLDIIKLKPRPAFYHNLVLAYQAIGDISKAQQVQTEANYLFPSHPMEWTEASPSVATSVSGSK
ncbi:PglL family O-oligosaccharyltransferase [Vibrio sp.]|uniref:PglL family O-oligosaccharyltransferase n=1 Tax=Vibrio sp. TaxID=678 RepID=UPI003D0ADC5B